MNNNRKSNQPIRLTEQDLHFLVEESVKGYLRENGMQEDVWGGLKNVWNGVKQGNLHVGTTYKTGNWASSFQKYAQQVSGIIQKMQVIAQKSKQDQIYNDLASVRDQFFKTAQEYNQMAQNAANTTPQFNTQVKSGFVRQQPPPIPTSATNGKQPEVQQPQVRQPEVQQPQGQGQQPQGQQLPPIPNGKQPQGQGQQPQVRQNQDKQPEVPQNQDKQPEVPQNQVNGNVNRTAAPQYGWPNYK